MKKIICLLLVLAMCAVMIVSCANEEEKPNTSSDASTSTDASKPADESTPDSQTSEEPSEEESVNPYVDENGRYRPLEVKNFGGREFSIIVRGASAGTYQSDDFTTDSDLYGDTLGDAVGERNKFVEDTYGVTLKIYKSDTIDTDIRNEMSAQTGIYDLIMPKIPFLATIASEGALCDLNTLSDIHLDAPWYDENATDTFSINRQYFFTTGDITILNKVCTSSILFDKRMIKDRNLDNPYDLVKNHTWTYDKMKEMAKSVTANTSGDAIMDGKDTWGLLASVADALTFYGAAGQHLCDKDANDLPYLFLGKEQSSIDVIQQILIDMAEKGTWVVYAQSFEAPIWTTSLDAFAEGRILFRPSAFSATTKLRKNYDNSDFGIVPLPLWSTEQDDYCSYCGTGETVGFGILFCANDPDYSAYMVEAISAASKNLVTPAYMELNLKGKDARDDESLEMLNIIFDTIRYDIGDVFAFGGINTMFTSLVQSGSSDIISTLGTNKDAIESKIDETIEAFESLK